MQSLLSRGFQLTTDHVMPRHLQGVGHCEDMFRTELTFEQCNT